MRTLSVVMLTLLMLSTLTLAFNIQSAKASGTIYIRADGSIDPSTAPISSLDNVTYVFTDNIYDEIVVERSNVTIDGNGYKLQGSGTGYGFSLSGIDNATVRNTDINGFYYCIHLSSASYNAITGNNVSGGGIGGIDFDEYSDYNAVSDNQIFYNSYGIGISGSWNNLSSNILTHNGDGIILSGSNNKIFENNITDNAGGILCDYSTRSVISENNITYNRDRGIWLYYSSGIVFSGNKVTGNGDGIRMSESSNNTLSENHVLDNGFGVKMLASSGNVLRNNIMANNGRSFDVEGEYINDVDASNMIEGKPVYYWINQQGRTIPSDAGYLCLVNCTTIIAQGLNITRNGQSVLLAFTTNSTIAENNLADNVNGIELYYSFNNSLSGNNVTSNDEIGIIFNESSWNTVSGNTIETNAGAICFSWSSNNTVAENTIKHNYVGISLGWSLDNVVCNNDVEENTYLGISLVTSANNTICENSLKANGCGIDLVTSSSNAISHNNFVNNAKQVHDASWDNPVVWAPSLNGWSDGPPSGGNYWSDYNGTDLYRGLFQNETGSDGIGDIPYIIDVDNLDNYPLMRPWGSPQAIAASVDMCPETLNLCSKDSQVSFYIELPEGYTLYPINPINASTVVLNGTVQEMFAGRPFGPHLPPPGDHNNNSVPDLMIPFNRTELVNFLVSENITFGNVTLSLTGLLYNGTPFQGSCLMGVSALMGDMNCDGKVSLQDLQLLASAYNSASGDVNWDGNANFAEPWDRISLTDLVTVAVYYGQHSS